MWQFGRRFSMDSRSLLTPGAQSLLCLSALRVCADADKEWQEVIDRDTEIVLKIRAALKTRLGEDRYDLWLGGTTRITADTHRVQISAPTSFGMDRLRKSLLTEIQTVAQEMIGPEAGVEFVIDSSLSVASAIGIGRASCRRSTRRRWPAAMHDHRCCLEPSSRLRRSIREPLVRRRRVVGLRRWSGLSWGPAISWPITRRRWSCKQPGEVTPLLVHGPTGVGKTHLLEGIWSAMRRRGGRRDHLSIGRAVHDLFPAGVAGQRPAQFSPEVPRRRPADCR